MFIIKKKINGGEYYYLRDSQRNKETGKVKAISVAYLGKNKKEAQEKANKIIKDIEEKKNKLEIAKTINVSEIAEKIMQKNIKIGEIQENNNTKMQIEALIFSILDQ